MGDAKESLRAEKLAARRRLAPAAREAAARSIAARLSRLEAFALARTVALYAPIGAEVGTAAVARLARARGQRLAFPRLLPGERRLAFASCEAEALVPGPLGTHEPPGDAPPVPLSEIDCILVPGVAFDARGRRLGRGAGHYDATLAALPPRARRIGLAYEVQIAPSVPEEPHDAGLDLVVTESRVLGPAAPAGGMH